MFGEGTRNLVAAFQVNHDRLNHVQTILGIYRKNIERMHYIQQLFFEILHFKTFLDCKLLSFILHIFSNLCFCRVYHFRLNNKKYPNSEYFVKFYTLIKTTVLVALDRRMLATFPWAFVRLECRQLLLTISPTFSVAKSSDIWSNLRCLTGEAKSRPGAKSPCTNGSGRLHLVFIIGATVDGILVITWVPATTFSLDTPRRVTDTLCHSVSVPLSLVRSTYVRL